MIALNIYILPGVFRGEGPGAPSSMLGICYRAVKYGENASFAYNYCVNRPILKILNT